MATQLIRLSPDDWPLLRDVRLRALADAPGAFGSTWAREREFDEKMWRSRLDPADGPELAVLDGDRAVAVVGSFTDGAEPATVHLVSMWVDPAYRGSGAADDLINGFVDDARAAGRRQIELTVVDTNVAARRVYDRHGFRATGEVQPYPHDAARHEIVMQLTLTT